MLLSGVLKVAYKNNVPLYSRDVVICVKFIQYF